MQLPIANRHGNHADTTLRSLLIAAVVLGSGVCLWDQFRSAGAAVGGHQQLISSGLFLASLAVFAFFAAGRSQR